MKVSDVTYQDIHGTSATQVAVRFDCSKKFPCTGIKMEDVKLTYKKLAHLVTMLMEQLQVSSGPIVALTNIVLEEKKSDIAAQLCHASY